MKCQICQKRKGKHLRYVFEGAPELLVCEKCRRELCPTPEEKQQDYERAERWGEFQAELGAGCFDLP